MARLIVLNLDNDLVRGLEQRAAAHDRSAEAEHRLLLQQALRAEAFTDALRAIPAVGADADFERTDEPSHGIGL